MTTSEVADYLRITPKTIRNKRVRGHPLFSKGFHVNGQLRFWVDDVETYVQECANA